MDRGEPNDERRHFPRVKAPLYFRPAQRRLPRRKVIDLGFGGMRVYSDEPLSIGSRLEVELFLPDANTISCLTEVTWTKAIPSGNPANYDIGLRFLDVPEAARDRLAELLELDEDA